jgi:hypothetical protein
MAGKMPAPDGISGPPPPSASGYGGPPSAMGGYGAPPPAYSTAGPAAPPLPPGVGCLVLLYTYIYVY